MKLSLSLILLLILFNFACTERNKISIYDFQSAIEKADESSKNEDYKTAAHHLKEAVTIIPTHPPTIYNLAKANAILGHNNEAAKYLMKSFSLGYNLDALGDSIFTAIKEEDIYKSLTNKIKEMKKPINKSELSFTYDERDLAPESIAYDPFEDAYYLGSLYKYKIVKIDSQGNATDFITQMQDSLRMVIGIKVDAKRRLLWICNAVGRRHKPEVSDKEVGWTALFKYDLNTGSLIKKYPLFEKDVRHQFNDLAITKNGDVYTSDNTGGRVYRVLADKDELELFCDSKDLISANGVAFKDDESVLYVSGWNTLLYKIDMHENRLSVVKHPASFSTYGIDGLYYYENSLIAVQDGLMRISRFYLNETSSEIESMEILEVNNPVLDIPTTGVLIGAELHYIANCPLLHWQPDGSLIPEELEDVTILKTKL